MGSAKAQTMILCLRMFSRESDLVTVYGKRRAAGEQHCCIAINETQIRRRQSWGQGN